MVEQCGLVVFGMMVEQCAVVVFGMIVNSVL